MWTSRPSHGDTEQALPVGLRQGSRGHREKAIWSRVCSATALATAALLAAAGASASGVAQPAATHEAATEFKLACSRSFEQSQRLRNGSQYIAASEEAAKCANPKCGEALVDECSKIYDQLQTATPSVVFAARDEAGAELTQVAVSIDGHPSRNTLDGTPVKVDPGNHQFAFASDGYQPAEQATLIRAGEQFRPISALLRRIADKSSAPPLAPPASDPQSSPGIPTASYVLGAVSVVGLGTAIGFRVAGSNRFDALARECKPTCTPSAVDSARQKYTVSDVALGVAAAAAVAAITIYLVSPREHRPRAALQVSPSEHGLGAGISAWF